MAARVVMYRTPYCGYCMLAKRLLVKKGVAFEEIDVSGDPEKRAWLRQASGQYTPQIFVGDRPIGGYLSSTCWSAQGSSTPAGGE
jgi:glutaredoxin 3